jgi:integrase
VLAALTRTRANGSWSPPWRDHGLIFASDTGAPLDPENFSRAFAKLCTTAGLGHWHPHELRHSGASLMPAQGTPLHVASEILGPASITITKDVYGHLVEGDRRAVAASMSQALFGPEPGAVAPKDTEKAPPQSGQGR